MASEKKPAQREAFEQQDQSIKARKHELFEEPQTADGAGALKPFSVYVRETPPAPMSKGMKATLWAIGVLVVLLFLAALFFGGRRPRPHRAERARARTVAGLPGGPGRPVSPAGSTAPEPRMSRIRLS
jgi:hypothetical protein